MSDLAPPGVDVLDELLAKLGVVVLEVANLQDASCS